MIDSILNAVLAAFTMGSSKPHSMSRGVKSYSRAIVLALLL